jgi:CBS domain-containing protein
MPQTVAELMNRDLLTVTPTTPLSAAIHLLVDRQISGLPVVDESGKLVGVISESDLMWREKGLDRPLYLMFLDSVIYLQNPAERDRDLHKVLGQTVGEVMTAGAISITADATLPTAARVMHDKKIHRLPVVDAADRPIGIITQGDIVRAIAKELTSGVDS